ncbi:E3 ubiquitin-protein ligase SspH1 [Pseudomonas extremaustralis]|uniref:RING-type E3 ubiquitin transferase n=1 Tax=Pseudomonas extremaustralis TaxID=359110 RepID=A0A5M9IXJ4_9PSED|nr:DUF6543 domain-containing protein [Pseudomonas extremaustralis]KAA8560900.1 E3 ubiquitin-protein ligase SspH1 [Pseudomonas extremaustralis]
MPDSSTLDTPFNGAHYAHIRDALPEWLTQATPKRLDSLKAAGFNGTAPYPQASALAHQTLKTAIADHWHRQNLLDQRLAGLNDVHAFAEPLLKSALRADYGEVDVRNTYLRLYLDAAKPWWTINVTGAQTSKTLSLLDAALFNFAADETFLDFAFLGPVDARGQRDVLSITHRTTGARLTAERFKSLCRDLNIGRRYQQQLTQALGFNNPALARTLHNEVVTHHQAALKAAAHLALLKGDLKPDAHAAMLQVVDDHPNPLLDGAQLQAHTLSMMAVALPGIVLFSATPTTRVIAYIAEDPEHPVKEYPTPLAFMKTLTRQLRDKARYQVFFSQFVPHRERGAFFAALNARLSHIQWHQKDRTDSGPSWKDTPISDPNLHFSVQRWQDDYPQRAPDPATDTLWSYLFRSQLNKIVNDARDIAVSTADVDRHARWAWWDNLEQMLSDVFNAALLVLTPFVPGLGELMLAYSAYQIMDEVFEGVVDWAEGQGIEAWNHLVEVTDSIIQFALFAGAGKIGTLARLKLSPFVEDLLPVRRADGTQRLWNPDIGPYAQPDLIPKGSTPSASGLHQHQGKTLVALATHHLEVQYDAADEAHRVIHPQRPRAYRPRLYLNGDGAVVHEGEHPRTWERAQLMRRLGHRVQPFSDTQLEQLRIASGTEEGALRRVYVYNEPLPPLLDAGLKRLEAGESVKVASERIRTGQALSADPAADWFEQMVTELEGWPQDKALQVFLKPDLTGSSHVYGAPNALPADTLRISLGKVLSGGLPERVLGFLDKAAITTLLGGEVPEAQQLHALRNQLADYVLSQSRDIAPTLYRAREESSDPGIIGLRQDHPDLDLSLARRLLDTARPSERQALADNRRWPLRLRNQANELQVATDVARAFEGFYPPALPSPLTETLVLKTLLLNTDALAGLHLEIREANVTGRLRSQVGEDTAGTRRVLVRSSLGYAVYDGESRQLYSPASLYDAVLLALPTEQRTTLGFEPGESEDFKHWLMTTLQPLAERRKVLAEPQTHRVMERYTQQLLGGPVLSRCSRALVETHTAHARETLQRLFPTLNEQRLNRYIEEIPADQLGNTLNELTLEKQTLRTQLRTWKQSPTHYPKGSAQDHEQLARRRRLMHVLEHCWGNRFAEYTDDWGRTQSGARLELDGIPLPDSLPELTANFEHVTYLGLSQSSVGQAHCRLLKLFPSLRSLDLSHNTLLRVPVELEAMRFLQNLNLSNNSVVLRTEDLPHLRNLRRMQALTLAHNPLETPPDISLMPDLRLLDLSYTRINQWPAGLFAHIRNEAFDLDLSGNPITALPPLPPEPSAAATVARTRLDRNILNDDQRELYERYRTEAGLDPYRTYAPQADSDTWMDGADEGTRLIREQMWDAVEEEHGSQGFFEVIKFLEPPEFFQTPEDSQRHAANQAELTQQVWRLINATHADSALRERLFKMSSFPGRCNDGGAQIFNEMGVEVLASEAQRFSVSLSELEGRLVTLAKGTARLKHLGQVAQAEIARRVRPKDEGGEGLSFTPEDGDPSRVVDEVDVHLAYQTSLADRLDLPWVSDHMRYRTTGNVSPDQVEQAYTSVLELGQGDGLLNQMLLEPYWETYLRETHDSLYQENAIAYTQKFYRLDDLQALQAQWIEEQEPLQKARFKDTLKALAHELETSESVVFGDTPISDEHYNRLLNDLGYNEKEWMRRLTRQALGRAGTRRNRAPKPQD